MLRGLLKRCGCTVLEAADGLAGLQAAATAGPIDLLVTDESMPCLDGCGLTRRLVEQRPALKVLFISIHALDEQDVADACPGAAQFLPKPFTADELTKKVGEMLEAQQPTGA